MEENQAADIEIKSQRSWLLPWVTLKSVYVVCTKYKSKALLAYNADLITL